MKCAIFIKNTLLLLLIAQCALSLPLKAMETPEEKLELSNLPNEVLFKIAFNIVPKKITSADQLLELFKNLTKLMATNKQFYDLIQSKYFLNTLEKKLSKKIGNSVIIATAMDRLEGKINEPFMKVLEGVAGQLNTLAIVKFAIRNNDIKAVEKFLPAVKRRNFTIVDEFTPVDEQGKLLEPLIIKLPALIYVIQHENIELVKLLLDHGANSNIHYVYPDIYHAEIFPLWEAVAKDTGDDIIELLLAYGANIEEESQHGETALKWAAILGNDRAISLLIKHGANIQIKDKEGFTPLLTVSFLNNPDFLLKQLETTLVLLKNHANINAQTDTGGKTALMYAVKHNNPRLVAMLLRYGASTKLKDNKGRTALSIAQEKGYTDIVELLKKYSPK